MQGGSQGKGRTIEGRAAGAVEAGCSFCFCRQCETDNDRTTGSRASSERRMRDERCGQCCRFVNHCSLMVTVWQSGCTVLPLLTFLSGVDVVLLSLVKPLRCAACRLAACLCSTCCMGLAGLPCGNGASCLLPGPTCGDESFSNRGASGSCAGATPSFLPSFLPSLLSTGSALTLPSAVTNRLHHWLVPWSVTSDCPMYRHRSPSMVRTAPGPSVGCGLVGWADMG